MKISEQEVRHVANLANLQVGDEELVRLARDVDHVLEYIEKLNELDTSAVEPMAQVLYEAGERATLREDIERPSLPNDVALRNAAQKGAGMYKVPRVIER
jgi:aspartyl-tRNA(Asn)/glutamyl-tRNA(Gln) amidotransferase subunit C